MRNLTLDITGMLLHVDNIFLHYLEGPEASFRGLLARLSQDPRHQGMGFWFIEPTAERLMPDHPMAFGDGGGPSPLAPALQAHLHMLLHGPLPEAAEPMPSSARQIEFWRFCAESLPT